MQVLIFKEVKLEIKINFIKTIVLAAMLLTGCATTQYHKPESLVVDALKEVADKYNYSGWKMRFVNTVQTKDKIFSQYILYHPNADNDINGYALADIEDGKVSYIVTTSKEPSGTKTDVKGQTADMISTVTGLAAGAAELNPLGVPGVGIAKAALLAWSHSGSVERCINFAGPLARVGWTAFGGNMGTLGAIVSGVPGLHSIPLVAIGATIGFIAAKPTANELFWTCAPDISVLKKENKDS